MTDFRIRPDCRLCGSTYTEVLDLGETALANEVWEDPSKRQDVFPLKLVQCDSCGHLQNPVVVDPKRLFGKYSYTSGLTEAYREHLKAYAREVVPYLDPGDLLVEIGGNDGTFGAFVEEVGNGRQYINVDPSDVEQTRGMRFTEFFTPEVARRIRSDFGPARVIVANHVFAHADDLHSMAEGVRELLADDGVFFCEVGHGPTQLRGGLSVCYHEHLSYHDARSFSKFLRRHGLTLKKFDYNQAQGGSVRFEIVRARADGLAYGVPEMAMIVEPRFDLPAIKAKAAEMRGLGQAFQSLLGGGDEIAVYGAPAKLTTLTALLRFRPFVVFDDSPRKVGKCIPGSRAPVVARIREPDLEVMNSFPYILIASWNFEREIRERWSGYTGTWIIPEPTVRFVPGGGA